MWEQPQYRVGDKFVHKESRDGQVWILVSFPLVKADEDVSVYRLKSRDGYMRHTEDTLELFEESWEMVE